LECQLSIANADLFGLSSNAFNWQSAFGN